MGTWRTSLLVQNNQPMPQPGPPKPPILLKFVPVIQPEPRLSSISPIPRDNLQVRDMHITVKLALHLLTFLHGAMMTSIADGISARIRLPTRKPSCQISKSIQLLSVKSPVMPRNAAIVWAFAAKVIVVAEFLMSQPRVDRFHGFDMRIDSLSKTISINGWFGPAIVTQMHGVIENALEIALPNL